MNGPMQFKAVSFESAIFYPRFLGETLSIQPLQSKLPNDKKQEEEDDFKDMSFTFSSVSLSFSVLVDDGRY